MLSINYYSNIVLDILEKYSKYISKEKASHIRSQVLRDNYEDSSMRASIRRHSLSEI